MRRTVTPLRVLLIGLLILLSAGQRDAVFAGTNEWTANGPEGGGVSLALDPLTPTTLYAGTREEGHGGGGGRGA